MMMMVKRLTLIAAAAAADAAAFEARETATFQLEQDDEYDHQGDQQNTADHDQRYLPRLQRRAAT